jgi:hypothetical protein
MSDTERMRSWHRAIQILPDDKRLEWYETPWPYMLDIAEKSEELAKVADTLSAALYPEE